MMTIQLYPSLNSLGVFTLHHPHHEHFHCEQHEQHESEDCRACGKALRVQLALSGHELIQLVNRCIQKIGLLASTGRRGLTNPNPCVALLHHTIFFSEVLDFLTEVRRTGFGRAPSSGRKPTQGTVSSAQDETYDSTSLRFIYVSRSSADDSQLWDASQRTPSSNPEEGLEHLLLTNNTLVITRKLEMLSIFMGFEQSNRHTISNEAGEPLGCIAEEPRGVLSMFARQIFCIRRLFRALVMDLHGSPILWIRRPFAWINSRMFIQRSKDLHEYTPEGGLVLDTFAEV
ncbi:Scramblase-domain-containing protein [Suillus fuscotomentosus]|uniref:Phospholipid scramblase n=1 Tax=Suillus fuscotomentosus TaxID=1912939 RepID=A0AAD4HMW0_9AGAM|nr:Scramblase-domain-containing protein [Suillus fuscotomentosus]KAG1902307.1 Scramblase-domain-containing protein [Suillus fuscotomentosus]